MKKIYLHMKLQDKYRDEIRQVAPGWDILDYSNEDRMKSLKDAEVMFGWSGEAERICLTAGTDLRWVHTWGAGVCNAPRYQDIISKKISYVLLHSRWYLVGISGGDRRLDMEPLRA